MIPAVALTAVWLLSSGSLRAQTAAAPPASVEGVVYDSLRGQPLAGATVQMVASPPGHSSYATATDSLGHFRVDSMQAGRYIAGFFHPLLDTLGMSAPFGAITVSKGTAAQLALAIPPAERLTSAICGEAMASIGKGRGGANPDSAGILVGHVFDAVTGAPMPATAVTLEWPVLTFDEGGMHSETRHLRATTVGDGWFAMCGLSSNEYQVHAAHGRRASGLIDIAIRPHDVTRLSLTLGSDSTASTTDTLAHGSATLSGTVITRDARPLQGVQVVVDGTAATATTDARGAFALAGLPDGTRMIEARAIGYAPVRLPIEPSRTEQRSITIVMRERVSTLDALTIYGKPGTRTRDLTGFAERKRLGFGRFITQDEIDQADVVSVCELLRRVPGLNVEDDGTMGCRANIRGDVTGVAPGSVGVPHTCEPTVYEDNVIFTGTLAEVARSVPPHDIMGIEVYSSSTQPAQFNGPCGSIVIWTRMSIRAATPP